MSFPRLLGVPLLLAAGAAFAQTPTVNISDAAAAEGDSGLTPFVFTVSLSEPTPAEVRVKWFTERCTAIPKAPCEPGADYVPAQGVVRFAPFETAKTIEVDVIGDTEREGQEVFSVVLSEPTNAELPALPQGQGQGIILNDDGALPAPPVADFNADGRTDILWRHQVSNRLVTWLMDGLNRVSGEYVTADGAPATADPGATLVGTADWDGDGDGDLLFQHADGRLEYWYLAGTTRIGRRFRDGLADTGWKIVGAARFNDDRAADLLWRHETTGRLMVWYMNDRELLGTADLNPPFVPSIGDPSTPDLNWRVVGLGDFDGDGGTDLLFRHEVTRRLVYWLMDGVDKRTGGYVDPDRPGEYELWDLAGVWDVDQDGIADLVFRHQVAGTLVAWYLNGNQARVCGTYFNPPALPDLGWKMVGPR